MADPGLENDRAALAAFRAGEPAALERVYYALVDDIYRLAAGGFRAGDAQVRPERDPDEQRAIIQDVFLRAFSPAARNAYDGLRPYRPYLLTIARNFLVDRSRARALEAARRADIDLDTIIATDAALPSHVDDDIGMRELRDRARGYIATLDAELRELVRLRFDDDLSQADAATALGVSRRRVRTLEARVLKGLRRFLKKDRPAFATPQYSEA